MVKEEQIEADVEENEILQVDKDEHDEHNEETEITVDDIEMMLDKKFSEVQEIQEDVRMQEAVEEEPVFSGICIIIMLLVAILGVMIWKQ